jgi:hypothetical protein
VAPKQPHLYDGQCGGATQPHLYTVKTILSANDSKTALKATESVRSSFGRRRSKRPCQAVSARSDSSHLVGTEQVGLPIRVGSQLLAQRLQGPKHVTDGLAGSRNSVVGELRLCLKVG